MKFIKTGLIFTAAAFGIVACAEKQTVNTNVAANTIAVVDTNAQPTIAAADEFAASGKIYAESCVGCHRENGAGGAAEYEGRKIKVPSFQSKGATNASDDNLYAHIANGEEDEMPAFKDRLTDEQMKNLVSYIRKEFQNK